MNDIKRKTIFHQLHQQEDLLILPNIWDVTGACLLEKVGFKAIATGSGAVSNARGFRDGQRLPYTELLTFLQRIVAHTSIPVTADIERAYATDQQTLTKHIQQLVDIGISGINYEDSFHDRPGLLPLKKQVEDLKTIRKAAQSVGSQLFINARTDVYIKATELSSEEKLSETILRAQAYEEAGADAIYPILLTDKNHITNLIAETKLPVNILLTSGTPSLKVLQQLGVKRVSMGSGFFHVAIRAMKSTAEQLLFQRGEESIKNSPLPPQWMEKLTEGFS